MVGVYVDLCDFGLGLDGIYLFATDQACRRWQYEQLIVAKRIAEVDGVSFYEDEAMDSWEQALDACREDCGREGSFFQIMDVQHGVVQQGVVHAA